VVIFFYWNKNKMSEPNKNNPNSLDLNGIVGPDDLITRAEANEQNLIEAQIKAVVGDTSEPYSNAWMLQKMISLGLEPVSEVGYECPLVYAKLNGGVLEDWTPYPREVRERSMQVNDAAFDLLKDIYLAAKDKAVMSIEEVGEGYTHIVTTTPTRYGFNFEERRVYGPGHDPKDDPIPDHFTAMAAYPEEVRQELQASHALLNQRPQQLNTK
jgi:hypothetical protein